MPDLETQLRNLADHRAARVPERQLEATQELPATVPSASSPRSSSLAAAAILLLILGVGGAVWLTTRDEADITVLTDSPVFDPAPMAMTDRPIVERDDWTTPLSELATPATFVVANVDKVSDVQAAIPARAAVRYRPASTYKLLNALLFQAAGVATGLDDELTWDGIDRGLDSWNQDHTLASALEVSAVWVFEELSGRMDPAEVAELVAAVGYGNADVGDAAGAYWLDGDLRISAIEQLAFLEDLYWGRLPVDQQDQAELVEAMTKTEAGGATIRYKTGTALQGPDPVAWLVGIVEPTDTGAYVFAFNADLQLVDGELQSLGGQERVDLVIELLTTAGIIG